MPTEERMQGRCGQQRRGEDQGRGESGAWGPSTAALAVPHLPEQSQRPVWSAQARWCGFGFSLFYSDYQSCACSCRKSKSPNPSPEVTSPLMCIVNPSRLSSLHIECTFYFCKNRMCSTAVFHPTFCHQDPSVPLPGDLMAAP